MIFGFFGVYQFRAKYIITYGIWNFLWIGWNAFVICFYLSVGILDKDSDILNLGTGSVSWFESNGYGCKPIYSINITTEDTSRPFRPERVEDCVLDYSHVEIIHAAVQLLLSVLALIGGALIAKIFLEEDDRFDFMGGDAKSPQHTVVHPMYVSYSCLPTATISPKHTTTNTQLNNHHNHNLFGLKSSNNALNTNSSMSSLYNTNYHQTRPQRRLSNLSNPLNNNNINRPDIRYTELSTEQLVQNLAADRADDHHPHAHENYLMQNLRTFRTNDEDDDDEENNLAIHNVGYVPQERPNQVNESFAYNNNNVNGNNMNNHSYVPNYSCGSDDPDLSGSSSPPPPPSRTNQSYAQQQQRFNSQFYPYSQQNHADSSSEQYVMPTSYPYVTRSPNLNRNGSGRRRHNHHHHHNNHHNDPNRPSQINFVDKIRDAPPGYVSINNYSSIQRAKSQDRLSQRRQSGHQQRARPRSYCSNNGNLPENL